MSNEKDSGVMFQHALATNGTVFVAAGITSGAPEGKIYYTHPTAGDVIWNEASVTYHDDMIGRTPRTMDCVTYNTSLNMFIGVGRYNFYTSVDGLNWNAYKVMKVLLEYEHLQGISVAENGNMVTMSSQGRIFFAHINDPSTWLKATTELQRSNAYGVINDNNHFYIYGDYILRAPVTATSYWHEYNKTGSHDNIAFIWAGMHDDHPNDYFVKYSGDQNFVIQRLSDLFNQHPTSEQPTPEPVPEGALKTSANHMCIENGRLISYGGYYVLNDNVAEVYPYIAISNNLGEKWEVANISWRERFGVSNITFSSTGRGMMSNQSLTEVFMSDDNGANFYKVSSPVSP